MKKYYKPEVKRISVAAKEQVLTFCKTDAPNDLICFFATGEPARDIYPITG